VWQTRFVQVDADRIRFDILNREVARVVQDAAEEDNSKQTVFGEPLIVFGERSIVRGCPLDMRYARLVSGQPE